MCVQYPLLFAGVTKLFFKNFESIIREYAEPRMGEGILYTNTFIYRCDILSDGDQCGIAMSHDCMETEIYKTGGFQIG